MFIGFGLLVAQWYPVGGGGDPSILIDTDFVGANANPIGDPWTTQPPGDNLQRLSNALHSATAGVCIAYYNVETPDNDQYVKVTIDTLANFAGCMARGSTTERTSVNLLIGPGGTLFLQDVAAGSFTTIDSAAHTHTPGDVYELRVEGTTATGLVNDVVLVEGTTVHTSGEAGPWIQADTTTEITRVVIGNISSAPASTGTNYYVRTGATGANDGSDWTNAWPDTASVNWSLMGPDTTLWYAGGDYNGPAFVSFSGSFGHPANVKAATVASHGTSTGWNNTYAINGGAGAVRWNGGFVFNTGSVHQFVTIDGQMRSSLIGGYGIQCYNGFAGDLAGIFAGGGINNLTVRYVDTGSTSTTDNNIDGIQGRGDNLTVEFCYIHDNDNRGVPPDDTHGDGIQWFQGSNCVIRYNYFRHNGQHIYTGGDGEATSDNWKIYYNFFDNAPTDSPGTAGYAINAGGGTANATNWKIYNNTFAMEGLGQSTFYPIYPDNLDQMDLKNNAWYDTGFDNISGFAHSYNGYDNSSTGLVTNIPDPETGKVVAADLGFVAAESSDFRLLITSVLRGAGTDVSSVAVNSSGLVRDILGTAVNPTTPDIGAFQYTA